MAVGQGARGEGARGGEGGSPTPARLGCLDERERGAAARTMLRAGKGAAERGGRWQPLERGGQGRGADGTRGGQAREAGR